MFALLILPQLPRNNMMLFTYWYSSTCAYAQVAGFDADLSSRVCFRTSWSLLYTLYSHFLEQNIDSQQCSRLNIKFIQVDRLRSLISKFTTAFPWKTQQHHVLQFEAWWRHQLHANLIFSRKAEYAPVQHSETQEQETQRRQRTKTSPKWSGKIWKTTHWVEAGSER